MDQTFCGKFNLHTNTMHNLDFAAEDVLHISAIGSPINLVLFTRLDLDYRFTFNIWDFQKNKYFLSKLSFRHARVQYIPTLDALLVSDQHDGMFSICLLYTSDAADD